MKKLKCVIKRKNKPKKELKSKQSGIPCDETVQKL